jgi:hypothetical protein
MKSLCKITLIAAVLWAVFSWPATAQLATNCAMRDAVVKYLSTNFGEKRRAYGYTANGLLIELFRSSRDEVAGNTFTIVVTSPRNLQACVISAGAEWTTVSAGTNIGGKND